jgi:uncharacterized membrane protein YdjX (TVP38/TMEM64 family)
LTAPRLAIDRRWIWAVGLGLTAILVGYGVWLIATDAPTWRFLVRLYVDRRFLKHTLRDWGTLAPVVFIGLQALQVVIAPIPGEVTGILGGYLFGQWLGTVYSTIGLTLGSVAAFGVGRWLGARYVRGLVSPQVWNKLGFIVEAEGAILCFIFYLVPGLPKDVACYLFGLSLMPFWMFTLVSTVGRIPGTWVLSAQGAHAASGQYLQIIVLTLVVVAVALPLYYYRHRMVGWFQTRGLRQDGRGGL